MKIDRLQRAEIEDKKWNGCVHFAANAFPYGYTWYLDCLNVEWEGLVYGDYEMVFPLVHKKKWGIDYLYQPFFAQQLGLFATIPIDKRRMHAFLKAIPEEYKYIDIQVNFLNHAPLDGFEYAQRTNLELRLDKVYEEIRKGYKTNLKRNIAKASNSNLKLRNNIKIEKLVDFFREHTGKGIPELKDEHYHTLHRIIYKSMHYNVGGTFGALNQNDELIATAFYLFTPSRIINLLPSSSKEGKEVGAAPYILDHIIRTNAGRRVILDMEGSNIDSIARYYKGFGAEEVPYWQLKRNNLPWFLKLLKP